MSIASSVTSRASFRVSGSRQLLLPALLLAATFCPAAISFQQRNAAVPQRPQSIVSVTYADAQAAGDTNIVAVGWSDVTSSVIAVSDTAGNVYTLVIGPTRQSGAQSQSIYVANNVRAVPANTNTVTVTFNTAARFPDVRILSYRGVDPVSPVEAAVGAGGSGTTSSSGSLTTVNANDLLFAANCVSSLTRRGGSGFITRVVTSPDGDIAQDRIAPAPGTYSATASMSSGNWVMQLVALKAADSQPATAAAATPTFGPAPGTYTATQSVTLQDATPAATIYYTTDGVTNPTTSSAQYSAGSPIQVSASMTIKAMATANGFANSPVATGVYTIQSPVAATPTFTPPPGTYTATQSVALQDATPGAAIYYTTDGVTNPTTSSAQYSASSPIQVSSSMTIKAMATANGFASSAVAAGVYSIQPLTAATPTFTPPPGNYTSTQSVSLLDTTAGATIYYTTDGVTNPTTSSAQYNPATPIQVSANTTIKAMAVAGGFANSAVATGPYTIGDPAPVSFVQVNSTTPQTPQTSVALGYPAAQTAGDTNIVVVGWSNTTSSVTSVTDSKGNIYTPAIGPTRQSGIQSQSIYVAPNIGAAAAGANTVTVAFNSAAPFPDVRILEYSGLAPLTPLDAAAGAFGRGTTADSGPLATTSPNDLLFAADTISSLTIGAGSGFISRIITQKDSNIAEDRMATDVGTYNATTSITRGDWVMQLVALKAAGSAPVTSTPAAASPGFTPPPGVYTAAQTVRLQDATAGASIYYTLDGSTPSPATSALYTTPIQVTVTTTIRAIAAASGFSNSAVATGLYTIQPTSTPTAAATPTFTPAPGAYTDTQMVSLQDTTPGASIFYTLDGVTSPTTSSPQFTTQIQVSANTTIKAIAAASGFTNSAVATGTYTIGAPSGAVPALVQHVSGSNSRNNSFGSPFCYHYQLPNFTTAGNAVVVGFTFRNNPTPSVADDKNDSYAIEVNHFDSANSQSIAIAAAFNVAAGARVIKVCFSSDPGGFVQPTATEFANATAIDGSGAGSHGTGTTVSAGSLTPSVTGDLVYQIVYSLSTSQSSFTAGSQSSIAWNLLSADLLDGFAAQYGVYNSTAAINPTIGMGTSQKWVSVAVLLKSGAAGGVPSGMRIVHLMHENVPSNSGAGGSRAFANPLHMQFPSSGNLLVAMVGGGNPPNLVSTLTDSNGNTWTLAPNTTHTTNDPGVQAFYAANAKSTTSLALTANWTASGGDQTFFFYDVVGASTSPFDVGTGGTGTQTRAGNLTVFSLTPASAGELIFVQTVWRFNTGAGLAGSGQLFDANFFDGESHSGPEPVDENNGWGHVFSTGSAPVTFTWIPLFANLPFDGWAGNAVAFKPGP